MHLHVKVCVSQSCDAMMLNELWCSFVFIYERLCVTIMWCYDVEWIVMFIRVINTFTYKVSMSHFCEIAHLQLATLRRRRYALVYLFTVMMMLKCVQFTAQFVLICYRSQVSASVMLSESNGVAGLHKEVMPFALAAHCVCHRLHLAVHLAVSQWCAWGALAVADCDTSVPARTQLAESGPQVWRPGKTAIHDRRGGGGGGAQLQRIAFYSSKG